ncbi:MAG TPA: hypothetical protein DHN33_03825, partial [Eubacteriaceae bacterium]|nr:hypothetical protein [Eubacteriaceae bacterium]
MNKIDSKDNKRLKFLVKLKQSKMRKKEGLYTVEGLKSVQCALKSAKVRQLFFSESFLARHPEFVEEWEGQELEIFEAKDHHLKPAFDTITPEGVIAVVEKEEVRPFLQMVREAKRILILDGLKDPGNVGTMIRTADAFGYDGVVALNETVELYHPKVVRSSMGSFFHIDRYQINREDIDGVAAIKEEGILVA